MWRQYYPHCKGTQEALDDLITDIYTQFLTKKSRIKGNEQSLLDKWDPERLPLPTLVKVSVIRMLIDRERTDKREINYAENYDEKTGELTLDFLAKKVAKEDENIEEFQFTPDMIFLMRDKYDEMSPEEKQNFIEMFRRVKSQLSPNFQKVFLDLIGKDIEMKNPGGHDLEGKINEIVPNASASEHKITGGVALKVTPNSDDYKNKEKFKELEEMLTSEGYKFHTQRSGHWYFVK